MEGRWALAGMAAVVLVVVAGYAQGGTVSTELSLRALVREHYEWGRQVVGMRSVRPPAGPDPGWTEFCTTPGSVALAAGQELSLVPLDQQGFSDAELGQLAVGFASLTNLTWLDLRSCVGVTDAGLVHVAESTNLMYLDLGFTGVTDAGLPHLAGLTDLPELYLDNTGVTDAGEAALKEKLPGCTVYGELKPAVSR